MSFYLIVFQGGNAVGSAVMGITAQRIGLSLTLLAAAAGLALGPIAGLRYRFQAIPPQELLPAGDWPQPHLTAGHAPAGPVMATVEYRPREGLHDELLAALEDARFSRRRTGEPAPGGPGRTPPTRAGSSNSSLSPPGTNTSGSTSASPSATSNGSTRSAP
jgi:hypothetical protein